jgi:uncharacterized damage-inducible protein DinB
MSQSDPPLAPDELVAHGSEREILETFLDLYRGIMLRKVADVPDDLARRRLVPSLTTLAGLLKHLAWVERDWFAHTLARHTPVPDAPPADGFEVGPEDTIHGLVDDYVRACAESRDVAAGFALDDTAPHDRLGRVSLRWIYVHMIEETARHTGHADILREQTDGTTGFDA